MFWWFKQNGLSLKYQTRKNNTMTTTNDILSRTNNTSSKSHGIIIDGVTVWQPEHVHVKVKVKDNADGSERFRIYTISRTSKENSQDHCIYSKSFDNDGRFSWNEREGWGMYADDASFDKAIKRIEKMNVLKVW